LVNIGTGTDVTIKQLAETIAKVVGFDGSLEWDRSKPDGTPRKLMDVSKIHALGWHHTIELEDGLRMVYEEIADKAFV
jgi:GDP-L-fucose synthase